MVKKIAKNRTKNSKILFSLGMGYSERDYPSLLILLPIRKIVISLKSYYTLIGFFPPPPIWVSNLSLAYDPLPFGSYAPLCFIHLEVDLTPLF